MPEVGCEMPQYQCHKKVWALKIAGIVPKENPDPTGRSAASSYGARIVPADEGFAAFEVDAEYVCKHNPKAGGYYVVYDDGYKSFSPAQAFESGYAPIGSSARTVVTEGELAAKAVAPRVTPADIRANIVEEHYFTASDGAQHENAVHVHGDAGWLLGSMQVLTFCVLVLRNGFTVTGESAPARPENFDPEIGRRIARENAVQKIWPLMGYALKSQLAGQQ
ncbi:Gp49 family protein [Variovorax sp. WS11]|uniref:Gp49 family protein n=1 Tax=Variovorax sp. WS11 TaxID=1105204 RepID=UPI001EF34564|nr:Gp49 family protein [Variovorax sp. WS11]